MNGKDGRRETDDRWAKWELRITNYEVVISRRAFLASYFLFLASILSLPASQIFNLNSQILTCKGRPPYQTPPAAGECGLRNKSRWDYQPQTGCLGLMGNRRSMLLGPASPCTTVIENNGEPAVRCDCAAFLRSVPPGTSLNPEKYFACFIILGFIKLLGRVPAKKRGVELKPQVLEALVYLRNKQVRAHANGVSILTY